MTVLSRTAGRAAAAAGAALLGALAAQAPAAATTDAAAGREPARTSAPVAATTHGQAPSALAPNIALQSMTPEATAAGLGNALVYTLRPVKDLRLDPFANSKADPLDNEVAVIPKSPGPKSPAPLTSRPLTAPLSGGGGAGKLPLVGPVLGALPG